jgi:ABC-type dipeptide/oligopeptide/nickel transport system permease subunit
MSRRLWAVVALMCLFLLLAGAWMAPEHLGTMSRELALAGPAEVFPFGADARGRSLLSYANQGARVVAIPSVLAGVLVTFFGVVGGLLRCAGSERASAYVQIFSEIVGALPRMVVILIVALLLPREHRSLLALAITWAVLAAPPAMDEAAAVAERLGGSRFVEALRAHGYSGIRIYLVHIVFYNLRPVVVRQGAEALMHVVFLEIALSYLALAEKQPSFTHIDSLRSWADLLKLGYPSMIPSLGVQTGHALLLGLGLLGLVALMSIAIGRVARAR